MKITNMIHATKSMKIFNDHLEHINTLWPFEHFEVTSIFPASLHPTKELSLQPVVERLPSSKYRQSSKSVARCTINSDRFNATSAWASGCA